MAKHVVVNSKKDGMIKADDISQLTENFNDAKQFETREAAKDFIERNELNEMDHCILSLRWFQMFK